MKVKLLQSLFTWIFYLFTYGGKTYSYGTDASILIHLDFLSICFAHNGIISLTSSFNPYSPGFSIYLNKNLMINLMSQRLQSLFTWIFYLFVGYINRGVLYSSLQSLFTWIFYLFNFEIEETKKEIALQSLFTWIFYLFKSVEGT